MEVLLNGSRPYRDRKNVLKIEISLSDLRWAWRYKGNDRIIIKKYFPFFKSTYLRGYCFDFVNF